ncbi:MAG: PhoH family protein [Candidatus Nanoarchaeia archaeon]
MTTTLTEQNYHEIKIPFEDIYSLGGPETFKKLERKIPGEKNLIVLPEFIFQKLKFLKKEEHDQGALETAEFIDSRKDIIARDQGVTVYKLYEGLNLAILHDENSKDYSKLEKRIKDLFKSQKDLEFITNDPFQRIELRNYSLTADRPEFLIVDAGIVNKGIITTRNQEFQDKLFSAQKTGIPLQQIENEGYFDEDLFINQFIRMPGENNSAHYARVTCDLIKKSGKIIDYTNARIVLLDNDEYSKKMTVGIRPMTKVLGITPLDMEQYLAFQYGLLNPDVSLFFLTGTQGSGKTLLSYVAAIDQILWYDKKIKIERGIPENENSLFNKLVLFKPNNIMGDKSREIGFLPGSMYEKNKPHLMPFVDAHNESTISKLFSFEEMLKHPRHVNDYGGPRIDGMQQPKPAPNSKENEGQPNYNKENESKKFKIEGIAYLPGSNEVFEMTYSGFARGRTFKNMIMLIDEAQNFTPYELKTLIERSGLGTKIIIMGDPLQLDNPSCSRDINGLTNAIKHYLPAPYSSLINLTRNYRSPMSEDARAWKAYSH